MDALRKLRFHLRQMLTFQFGNFWAWLLLLSMPTLFIERVREALGISSEVAWAYRIGPAWGLVPLAIGTGWLVYWGVFRKGISLTPEIDEKGRRARLILENRGEPAMFKVFGCFSAKSSLPEEIFTVQLEDAATKLWNGMPLSVVRGEVVYLGHGGRAAIPVCWSPQGKSFAIDRGTATHSYTVGNDFGDELRLTLRAEPSSPRRPVDFTFFVNLTKEGGIKIRKATSEELHWSA